MFLMITMIKERTKECTCAAAEHILSLLRVLEVKGTHSFPTPDLCQLQSSPEPHAGKLSKHHASASAKSRDVFGTGDFTAA